jgi:hypothetical protein
MKAKALANCATDDGEASGQPCREVVRLRASSEP